jgi:hypothetical protein
MRASQLDRLAVDLAARVAGQLELVEGDAGECAVGALAGDGGDVQEGGRRGGEPGWVGHLNSLRGEGRVIAAAANADSWRMRARTASLRRTPRRHGVAVGSGQASGAAGGSSMLFKSTRRSKSAVAAAKCVRRRAGPM